MSAQDAHPFHWHYPDLDDDNFQLRGCDSSSSLPVLLIVFSFLLFFTLLCLYIRCALWRRSDHTGPDTGLVGPSGLNIQISPVGLDLGLIGSLPVMLYGSGGRGGQESMCSICLSVLVEGEKMKMLPNCRHWFHPECVDEWLRAQSSCPLCRDCIWVLRRVEISNDDGAVGEV